MVLTLHPDKTKNNQEKATELFKQLITAYENRRSNGTQAGQGGNNQPAPQPHHTIFQFNPTFFRLKVCGQNEPHKETPQRAQQQSREEDRGNQGLEQTWSSWLWITRKSRGAEPRPIGTPPPQRYNTNTTKPMSFGEKFRWYIVDPLRLQRDCILREKRRPGWTGDYPNGGTRMYLLGPRRVYLVQVVAGCAWVPEERIWMPEVFIVGEGIHFIMDDSVRLMAQLNHANIIAAKLGLRTYGH